MTRAPCLDLVRYTLLGTVNPKIIVTVGLVSTKRFIPVKNMKDVVGHAHGNIVPMLHPASYLYSGRSPKVMDSMVASLRNACLLTKKL